MESRYNVQCTQIHNQLITTSTACKQLMIYEVKCTLYLFGGFW